MPEVDARGHTVPSAGEAPSRTGWVLAPLLTVRDAIPVANTTARAQKIAELAALPVPITPSAASPVLVQRADARSGCQYEYTTDGTTWWTLGAEESTGTVVTAAADYSAPSGFEVGRLFLSGAWVQLAAGRVHRASTGQSLTAGTRYAISTQFGADYRPTVEQARATTVHYTSGTPTPAEVIVRTDGVIEVRPYVTGTLGAGDADWVAIPDMRWRRA